MKRAALPLALLAGLAAWPVAPAADQATSAGLVQSTEVVQRGKGIEIDQSVRSVDGRLPPALNRLELRFPPGTRINSAGFPRCRWAKLAAEGPKGCVRQSRVGSGTVRAQVPFRFPHEFQGTVRIFNGSKPRHQKRRALLMYVQPQAGPSWVISGYWSGSRRAGVGLNFDVSPISIPEAEPDALVGLSLRIGARRDGVSFLDAPCPGRYQATAYYATGSVVTSSDRARCE